MHDEDDEEEEDEEEDEEDEDIVPERKTCSSCFMIASSSVSPDEPVTMPLSKLFCWLSRMFEPPPTPTKLAISPLDVRGSHSRSSPVISTPLVDASMMSIESSSSSPIDVNELFLRLIPFRDPISCCC